PGLSVVNVAWRESLTEFIALQMVRTSRTREQVKQMGDWYAKTSFEGMDRQTVEERLRQSGTNPTTELIDETMQVVKNIDQYNFVPPEGSFLFFFLQGFLRILPFLADGWNWVVVRSSRPLLASDPPVVL